MGVENDPSRGVELLVVEDSPTQAEQIAHLIQAHGYRVSIASNGKEALAALAIRKPMVVISDIVMPEMDGYELCRRIKTDERFQHIPVILVTALSDPKDVLAGLECGADNFIVKPYDADYLLSRIRYIIANRELRRRDTLDMGVEIVLGDRKYFINSARRQILDLLLSTYEAAVKKNGELSQAQHQLQAFAAQLESRVEERVKELTCLFNISRLVETAGESLEAVLQGIVELIPPAMQYPADTAARITLDGVEFSTPSYRDTPALQSRPIVVQGRVAGRLDVTCLAEQPPRGAVFLGEECTLITAIAERLGHIIERKRAEEQLNLAHARFRRLVDSNIVGIVIATAAGAVIEANDYYLQLIGTSRADLEHGSVDWRAVTPVEWRPADEQAIRELRERGTCTPYEKEYVRPDGCRVPVFLADAMLPGPEEHIAAFVLDLTQRKQSEEDLRRLNRLYAVLSQVNQSILRTRSRQELFQQVCEIAVAHGGFKLAWIGWHDLATHAVIPVGQSGDDLGYLQAIRIYADDRPEGLGPTGTCIREGRPCICNDFANDPNTKPWHKAAVARGLRASVSMPIRVSGNVCGAFMVYADANDYFQEKEIALLEEVAADISFALDNLEVDAQRQRAEQALHTLNVELEQRVHQRTLELATANAELEAFAYSVSHDLRAPLRHLDGFAQLLLKRAGEHLDETSVPCVHTIVEASAKMSQLIDDLLAFSRAGRVEMATQAVRLQPLVSAVQQELLTANANRRITWDTGPLPTVNADPALLRQVLVNLLSNAIKFTAPRSEGRIEIGATTNDKGEAVIYVRDNGVGFDPQYAHKLFGVFQRLHSSEQFEGTGIGLANVRRIIQRHGGRVWAEGAVDHGATFYFTLPQATAP